MKVPRPWKPHTIGRYIPVLLVFSRGGWGGGLVLTVSPSTSKSSFYISPQGYNPSVYDHWFSGRYSTSPYKDQMSEMEEWVMQRKLQSSAGLFPSQTSGQDTFCDALYGNAPAKWRWK